jgi:hypothetical protein
MSTLQSSAREPHQSRPRSGGRLVALGALIAIGAVGLVIAVATAGHSRTTNPPIPRAQTGAQPRSVAVIPSSFNGFFQDPTPHALLRVSTASQNGWPPLASVLAPLTRSQRQYVLGIASLSDAQLAAAFGTGR